MTKPLNILFVGESCFYTSTEYKGIDHFSETNYTESARIMKKLFADLGHNVTHIPCHRVALEYPSSIEELSKYDVVIYSDIGSNTFLLLPEMVKTGKRIVNRLKVTRDYVEQGGGFCMIGGYMTFQGMEAKGKWKDSVIESILPVELLRGDDRTEVPEGADLSCVPNSHHVLAGLPEIWPYILGYNKLIARSDSKVLVEFEGDPIISVREYGKGHTMAYAMDCAPHWAPAAMYEWEYYPKLWDNIVSWLANK